MLGIGFQEILVILLVALLVVGPKRLPQVARAIGKALNELRRAADEVRETLEAEELRRELEEEKRTIEEEGYKIVENFKEVKREAERDEGEEKG